MTQRAEILRVPVRYAYWAAGQYPDAHLTVYPGEGHGFSPAGDLRMQGQVLAFLQTVEKEKK